MSMVSIRTYCDKDLDGIVNRVLSDAEQSVFHKIRLLAAMSYQREGFIEWAIDKPYTHKEIATRIRSNLRLTNTTIEKCLKYKLLEEINGVLHVVDWETEQLSKAQRSAIHKAVERGKQTVEIPEGKPLNRDFIKNKNRSVINGT